MLAWLISLAEKAALVFLAVCLVREIREYFREKAKPTVYLGIRKRFEKGGFERTNATLISRGSNYWTETKRDWLNDKYEVEHEYHILGPDIERHIHTRAYKNVQRSDREKSQYEIKVDGSPYWLVSYDHAEKTLPVYYNPDFPMEIYTEEDVEKGLAWTDEDEKKAQKKALQPSRWAIIFYIAAMIGIFAHLKFF